MPVSTQKRSKYLLPSLGVFLLLGGLFYWYEIRPIRVYRQCTVEASSDARGLLAQKAQIASSDKKSQYQDLIDRNMYLRSDYESFLRKCLLYYGQSDINLYPQTGTGAAR